MAETLYIENFGPIKKAELDLRQAIVLIGPQASGKSTIAKLISIFRDFEFVAQHINFSDKLIEYNIHNYIQPQTLIKYAAEEYSVEIKTHEAQKITYKNPTSFAEIKQNVKTLTEAFITKGQKPLDPKIALATLSKVGKIILQSYYIPSERVLISMLASSPFSILNSKLSFPKSLLRFGAEFELGSRSKPKYKIPFLDFEFSFDGKESFVINDRNERTKLMESASGLQSIIPLLVHVDTHYISSTSSSTFVVEEPELNLFPKTQKDLVYVLSEKCLYKNPIGVSNELVITTHSPYVLTSFNNLLFANLVAQKPENATSVFKIIPQESQINANNFNAYFVANGTVEQIFNRETGLIDDNQLDSASEEIMADFNALMDIYKETK